MKKIGTVLWFLIGAVSAATALDYWISPAGNDSASGSFEEPWKTLAHANRMLRPGDWLWLANGEYQGSIAPQRGGYAEEPVVYCAASAGGARIVPAPGRSALELVQKECVIVNGVTLCGGADRPWMTIQGGGNLLLSDLSLTGRPGKLAGSIARSRHLIFRRWSVDGGGTGGVFAVNDCRSLTWESSEFRNFSSPVIHWENMRGNVRIRRNRFQTDCADGVFGVTGNIPEVTLIGNIFWKTFPARAIGQQGGFFFRNVLFAPEDPDQIPRDLWYCTILTENPERVDPALRGRRNNWIGRPEEGKFRNLSAGDFRLTAESPALDRGVYPDLLADSGQSGELQLEPGGLLAAHKDHFRNGFFWIGAEKTIVRVAFQQDPDFAGVIVEPAVAFRKGAFLALPWHGKAPDAGACEYGMQGSDSPPPPGEIGVQQLKNRDRNPEFRLENPFRRWRR